MMSKTVGPILATGLVTITNNTVFHKEPMDWRIPIATGLLAIGFSLGERAAPELAVVLAWTTFLTVMLTRTNPNVPSPVESAVSWWKQNQ